MATDRDKITEAYVDLVQFMANSLLDDDVAIEVVGNDDRDPLRIELHVPKAHRGRVIGRGGRIARAMRTLIDNSGIAYHDSVVLDIVD